MDPQTLRLVDDALSLYIYIYVFFFLLVYIYSSLEKNKTKQKRHLYRTGALRRGVSNGKMHHK